MLAGLAESEAVGAAGGGGAGGGGGAAFFLQAPKTNMAANAIARITAFLLLLFTSFSSKAARLSPQSC
jgi:preprotein translocase subunit SecG